MILLSSSFQSFIQLIGVLVIFLFVLLITYLTTRWIGGYQKGQMAGHVFRVVDTIRIAGGKYAQVLKIGEVYLVIAVGKDEITLLAELSEDEIGLTEEELEKKISQNGMPSEGTGLESFQETLDKLKDRFSKKQD